MATRGSDGSVEMQVTGDTSPLEASVAAAKAKINAEGQSGKVAGASTQAAADVAKVGVAAAASTEALKGMGQAGDNAVGSNSPLQGGLKGVNKVLSDSVGQVQALFGRASIAIGSIIGLYALLNRSIEESRRRVAENTKAYEAFAAAARSLQEEFGTKSDDKVVNQLDKINERYDDQLTAIYKLRLSEDAYKDAVKRNMEERAAAEQRVYDEAGARGRAAQSRLAADRRVQALEEENARRDSRLKQLDDQETKAKAMEADFDKLIDLMKQYEDQATQSAKRINEAFAESFRSIREESNRAFNTDQAASMVQLAGNLRTTAIIATANMNRIVVGGDD
jgi:biopolymer transport protein ExbB/TolQ